MLLVVLLLITLIHHHLHLLVYLLSIVSKAHFNVWFRKNLAYSQTSESHIHAHIDVVAKEAKKREDNIIEEARANKEKILAEISAVKGILDHLQDSTNMFNLYENDVAQT